jgi:hypothetical protein
MGCFVAIARKILITIKQITEKLQSQKEASQDIQKAMQRGLGGFPHERLLNPLGLNMAEIELSVLNRQCLNRRLPDSDTLKLEIAAWEEDRNQQSPKS